MQQFTNEAVVSLEGVLKCFRRYDHPIDRLKEVLASSDRKVGNSGHLMILA